VTGRRAAVVLAAALGVVTTAAPAKGADPAREVQQAMAEQPPSGSCAPIVIAHRGASAYRPEHTLAAYELAIAQGADFIEPDLVPTRDGVLVARHENALSGTTDVADRPDLVHKRTTKTVDGESVTDWFTEDFSLAELKTLHARERIPEIRPANTAFDGRFRVPTLAEIIDLVRRAEHDTGRRVGIYPEIKHPTYFRHTGRFLDGTPIRMDLGAMLVAALREADFTDPARVYIQSFEPASLVALKHQVLPAAGLELSLVQLIGDVTGRFVNAGEGGFSRPYDVVHHARAGDGLAAIYGDALAAVIAQGGGWRAGYGALASAEGADAIAGYADAIGPWKLLILPRAPTSPPVDADGDGRAEMTMRLTGEQTPLVALAHRAGLAVHPFTLRPEESFLAVAADGRPQSFAEELDQLLATGIDGLFSDDPAAARAAVKRLVGPTEPAPPPCGRRRLAARQPQPRRAGNGR
jgi:glycerophosphoryl diester phosphodiesterase